MKIYLLRRILLMIPTLFGISLACFTLIQFVPGGPVEEMIARLQQVSSAKGVDSQHRISEEEVANIKAYFGFDEPAYLRYVKWVWKVLHLDLGTSYTYDEPVWDVISSKFPISLFFGITSFLLSYAVCVPLGIKKAIRNQSFFDISSSTLIFIGYVIPGFALGVFLIIFFGGGSYLNWFPISGTVSDAFETMNWYEKTLDFLHHMVLPMICYMASEFAFLTLLMKNSLLEEIQKDYMRTALAKGASFQQAVRRHALRNALIPITTRLSELFTVMFAGALLIEKVFDIDGMGLLVWNSIVGRDYNVVMGIILLSSFFTMLGRIFSDVLYVVVDPRIRFE